MRPNLLLCFFLSGAAATLSGTVHSAPPPAKSDVATDKARELHLEGDELYKQGQYARARVSYLAAWALKKHWALAGNLGDCEVKLGMYRDAAEHLAYFLRTSPNQPPSAAAQKLYEQARSKTSTLTIRVDTEGADVLVDGQLVGKAPLADPVFVEPGHHSVEARLGPMRATDEKDVALGGESAVVLTLAVPAPPPPPSGSAAPPPPPPPATEPRKAVLIGGGVTAGVALAAGVIFAVMSSSKASDGDQAHAELEQKGGPGACVSGGFVNECGALHSLRVAQDRFADVSFWSFVTAGAIGAGTAIYALAAPKAAHSSGVRVAPVVVAHGGGVGFSGSW